MEQANVVLEVVIFSSIIWVDLDFHWLDYLLELRFIIEIKLSCNNAD